MVFVSKFIFEEGTNVIRCLDGDSIFERMAICDIKNTINIFSLFSINSYFNEYRKRFEEKCEFSHKNLKKPEKIAQIFQSDSSLIIKIRFSTKKFLSKVEILNKTSLETQISLDFQETKIIQTKQGKTLKLSMSSNKQKPITKLVKSFYLASGLENGSITIFSLAKIHCNKDLLSISQGEHELFSSDESYSEIWNQKFILMNENSLSVLYLEWSYDSNFLIALYFNQEIAIWGEFDINNEQITKLSYPKKFHKIVLNDFFIKSICSENLSNEILAISNENIVRISFSKDEYNINYYFQEKKTKSSNQNISSSHKENNQEEDKEEEDNILDNFEIENFFSSLNSSDDYLVVPFHKPNLSHSDMVKLGIKEETGGIFLYKFSKNNEKLEKIQLIRKFRNPQFKMNCCCFSKFLYKNFNKKEFTKQKIKNSNGYYILASVFENQIHIFKLFENHTKNTKNFMSNFLKIIDFKFLLSYCSWIDQYTLMVSDENGRMWFIKFNCLELGFVFLLK